jgi:YrbI family 3-deoxy-D-manno-octulosonate 8-phosphate phosphatase
MSPRSNKENPKGLIFDFDGVFTSNTVYVDENGKETVRCSRSDGLGLEKLRKSNVPMVVISTEKNPVVSARCKKLKIDVIQGCDDKVEAALGWATKQSVDLSNVVFVGNDINDIPLMKEVGHPWCVSDAWQEVKDSCEVILKRKGGDGAVREACENFLYICTAE